MVVLSDIVNTYMKNIIFVIIISIIVAITHCITFITAMSSGSLLVIGSYLNYPLLHILKYLTAKISPSNEAQKASK